MDYLTILSTRSLILFPSKDSIPTSSPTSSSSFTKCYHPDEIIDSPISSPSPPTINLTKPAPEPITLPLSSLIYNETNCAYFLVYHVLNTSYPFAPHNENQNNGQDNLGMVDKKTANEVEVIVWKEMDRVKMFSRSLGRWFGISKEGKMDESNLVELAGKYGLGLEHLYPTEDNMNRQQHELKEEEDPTTHNEGHRHIHSTKEALILI
ncbi:uncharacterized protein IL334_004902 [Kwoniella shivajii]|uniref:Uncharacterized protein n=1 Tax=Kwoniella shivajii TaxID=564305 RepID=A0ABZ1D1N2_9TREE|nr:hypothetical protein IL334_004902 [Kwoniella shivajii]